MKILYTALITLVCCTPMLFAQKTGEELKAPVQQPKSTPLVDSSQQIADMIVNSKIPVLVDFWAVWCGPCKLLNPIIKQLEKEYDQKVLFLKVNVDIHRSIASYFKINAIPAVFIIKDKTVVKMLTGVQPKNAYVMALDAVLNAPKSDTTKVKGQ